VFKTVADGGGNAVVFVGAIADRDVYTGELTKFTERAIAYKCRDKGATLHDLTSFIVVKVSKVGASLRGSRRRSAYAIRRQ
jgi:hypothetical protein